MLAKKILSVLIVGLERLSYRGYDSAGVAVVADEEISIWKRTGKVHVLAKELSQKVRTQPLGLVILAGRRMVFQMKLMLIHTLMLSAAFLWFIMVLSKTTCS